METPTSANERTAKHTHTQLQQAHTPEEAHRVAVAGMHGRQPVPWAHKKGGAEAYLFLSSPRTGHSVVHDMRAREKAQTKMQGGGCKITETGTNLFTSARGPTVKLPVNITKDMTMDALTPISAEGESHIKPRSPSASPTSLQDPLGIKPEPIFGSPLVNWKVEETPRFSVNLNSLCTSPSATPRYSHQTPQAPPTPEHEVKKCEPMSPSDNISLTSSPQFFGCQSSSESEDSEPWILSQHELVPDHSSYAHSPSSPASGWEGSAAYQFQGGPTSVGYYNDCSVPFSAATPPAMQANYSPAFETRSNYDSPQCPSSYFVDGPPIHQRPLDGGIPEICTMVDANASQQGYSGMIGTPTSEYSPTMDCLGARDGDINNLPYSKLLWMAFMSSHTKRLSLRQIYEWFEINTNKPNNNKGWQNSIRHNLSMNGAFQKAPFKEDGSESRRATEWILVDSAVKEGIKSTTRYRRNTGRSKASAIDRERMHSSYSGGRRAAMGYSPRGRDRLYRQRFQLHGMPSGPPLMYGSPVTPPPLVGGYPEVEGYMAPPGGLCYSPSQVQDGYNAFNPHDAVNSESYPMFAPGDSTIGNYAMIGGVPDGAPVETHASGVVHPGVAMPFVAPFPPAPAVGEEQNYSPVDYDTIHGMSIKPEGGHE
ncbi:hypothetical protein NLG97_g6260 [Lecanicillium saksenae]|uniref:Uncharacterized protein n=1 Tax=Lecanicillium saksenae TaxID=468837 RepID=A0ACC1QTY7_9HYPO|nr:hypothetical protein NLG97_g6260 [Lecanicillium saksenae]